MINAQSLQDALRYSRPEQSGTARYMAMGGAFNALGGDFSAINDNPAAGGVFVNSEFNVTLNSNNNRINSNYLEKENKINSENILSMSANADAIETDRYVVDVVESFSIVATNGYLHVSVCEVKVPSPLLV